MKRLLLLAGLVVAVGSAPLTAQDPAKPTTMTKDSITVTGCLQAGTAPDTFTLSNVTQTAAASSATGTTGGATASASATASPKGTDTKYELVAAGNVNLKPHVGHKVEITGTPDTKATAGTSGTATSTPAPSGGTAKPAAKKITVTAVKHVAASCP
jgi:hypothetical protein